MIRCLALVSLLIDLILNKDINFHKSVLKDLEKQELDIAAPVLRRPSEQWSALTITYRRSIDVFELTAVLVKYVNQLKVTDAHDLEFSTFHQAWNEERLNRLDFYLSDLGRLLRVGDILPVSMNSLWPELTKRWVEAHKSFQQTTAQLKKQLT